MCPESLALSVLLAVVCPQCSISGEARIVSAGNLLLVYTQHVSVFDSSTGKLLHTIRPEKESVSMGVVEQRPDSILIACAAVEGVPLYRVSLQPDIAPIREFVWEVSERISSMVVTDVERGVVGGLH